MPAIRQPLSQRCNVRLNVITAIPPEEDLDSGNVCDEDVSSRLRPILMDVRVPYNGVAGKRNPTPRLHPVSKSAVQRFHSLHELLPYLFVSFHTGSHLPTEVVTEDGAAFTHIVKITHETSKRKAGIVEVGRDTKRGLYTLILAVPTSAPRRRGRRRVRTTGERNTTLLTEYQLFAARDFLSLALPYYSQTHLSEILEGPIGSADRVRVLVTAPVLCRGIVRKVCWNASIRRRRFLPFGRMLLGRAMESG